MAKRDKFVAARIPKETDMAVKRLLDRKDFKHHNYSDIINMALESYIKIISAYPIMEPKLEEYILDKDISKPTYGKRKKK